MPGVSKLLLSELLFLTALCLQVAATDAAEKSKSTPSTTQAVISTQVPLTESEAKARQLLSSAQHLYQNGKAADAEKQARQVIELDPKLSVAHFLLALILRDLGKNDEAITEVQKDLDVRPNEPQLLHLLAQCYLDAGRLTEAVSLYRQIAARFPKDGDPNRGPMLMLAKAHSALNQKNYAEAEKVLRLLLELSPNKAGAHSALAYALSEMGQPSEAIVQQNKEIQLHPSAKEILQLGGLYTAAGRLDEALGIYRAIISHYPKTPEANQAAMQLAALKPEQQRQHSVQNVTNSKTSGDDYFDYATGESVTKWTSDRFPLRVFVPADEEASKVPHYRPQCGQALKDAFSDWADKTGGRVKFTYVNSPEKAEISCSWSNDPSKLQFQAEGGECRTRHGLNGLEHADIVILTANPKLHVSEIPADEIKKICLHEIGHSLGLLGHSPDPKDVMFCSAAGGTKELSDRDIRTMLHLYTASVRIAACSHPEATKSKTALNMQALQLIQEGNYKEAIKLLNAALKIDPRYEDAVSSLVICYNAFGVNSYFGEDYKSAIAYLSYATHLASSLPARSTVTKASYNNYILALRKDNRLAEAEAALSDMATKTGSSVVSEGPITVLPPPSRRTEQTARSESGGKKPSWILDDDQSADRSKTATPSTVVSPKPVDSASIQPQSEGSQRPVPSWLTP